MQLYQLTFMDAERGKIVQWKRNKREVDRFVRIWAGRFPLRKLLHNKKVVIPETKAEFVDWLNQNCGGKA